MELLKAYWRQSKSPFYSLLFTLPMLIAYELLIFTFNRSDIIGLRNGADILFRQFFSLFNVYGFYLVGFLVLSALLTSYYFHNRQNETRQFQYQFFILMLLESIVFAFVMFVFVDKLGSVLLSSGSSSGKKEFVVLALGAGVYEEFIFRVVLISGFTFFLKDILRLHSVTSAVVAVIAAALTFSLFHYMGSLGDVFEIKSFLIRFIAGIFLSILYVLRGYGITAYTHTFYDLLVILI
ncbi:MAG: CPBP family glutamic-type intramembrane protease [Candidatus Marinimicrobia bacterium]|nr:CPBP family glutamic-type intramembrane protease [Candidatus Neomarinimicrobiota bacterium]